MGILTLNVTCSIDRPGQVLTGGFYPRGTVVPEGFRPESFVGLPRATATLADVYDRSRKSRHADRHGNQRPIKLPPSTWVAVTFGRNIHKQDRQQLIQRVGHTYSIRLHTVPLRLAICNCKGSMR